MGCRCQDAAVKAAKNQTAPTLADAYPDGVEGKHPEDVFTAGVRTGLLWAVESARDVGFVTMGQRLTGVIGTSTLTAMTAKLKEEKARSAKS